MFKDFREICVNNNLLNFELNFFIISRGAIKPCIIAAPYQGALNLAERPLHQRGHVMQPAGSHDGAAQQGNTFGRSTGSGGGH